MVSATLFMACFSKCKDGANESIIKLAWILPSAAHSRRFLDCKGTKKNRDLQVYYPNIAEKCGIFRAYFAEK